MVFTGQIRCCKRLILTCLLMALGFVCLYYFLADVDSVSYWESSLRNGVWHFKGVFDTINRPNNKLTPKKTKVISETTGSSNQGKRLMADTTENGSPVLPTVPPEKRSPLWFLTDDTYSKSKCPSAIRKNPGKVPNGCKFIPHIPVLMWNEHINPAEYARLKEFRKSFGWNDITYGDVKRCLRHFNTSAHRYMFPGWTPEHTGCIRCAVVGNGGILRGSGKGKEIDGHDFVWRVNAAITEGFEDDVGKRTSFYFHCVNSMKNSQRSARKYGFIRPPQDKDTVYTSIGRHMRDYDYMDAAISWKPIKNGSRPPAQYGERPENTKFRMLHPDFMRYLKYYWLNSSHGFGRFANSYQPSKGAFMLLTALHTCDFTDAYGFITTDHGQYNSHYYEKEWIRFTFFKVHDFQMELDLWDGLDKAGLITLYRGNKNQTRTKSSNGK